MSAQTSHAADRRLVVHADRCGRLHVLPAGGGLAEPATSPRETIERHASELRQEAIDETAAMVAGWSWNMALRCAAALRREQDGQLLKPTTS